MPSVFFDGCYLCLIVPYNAESLYTETCYVETRYSGCRYTEWNCAKYHGANQTVNASLILDVCDRIYKIKWVSNLVKLINDFVQLNL